MKLLGIISTLLCLSASGYAAEPMTDLLSGSAKENYGWTFDNGSEFPGATGKLSVDTAVKHNGRESLRLDGNFTKGGNYVQAAGNGLLPETDIQEISFWLRDSGGDRLTLRINDSSGQCHQLNLKTRRRRRIGSRSSFRWRGSLPSAARPTRFPTLPSTSIGAARTTAIGTARARASIS